MNVGDSHVLVLRLDYQGMYVCCIMRVLLHVFIDWCLFIHASSPLCLINGFFHICGMYVCMYLCMYVGMYVWIRFEPVSPLPVVL